MKRGDGVGKLVGTGVPSLFFVIKVATRRRVDLFGVLSGQDPTLDLEVGVIDGYDGVDNGAPEGVLR